MCKLLIIPTLPTVLAISFARSTDNGFFKHHNTEKQLLLKRNLNSYRIC